MQLDGLKVIVRGGGDLGSGVIYRLYKAGAKILVCELPHPLVVRRRVAFANAIYNAYIEIEGISGRFVKNQEDILNAFKQHEIPVIIDPNLSSLHWFKPQVVVDARLMKIPPDEDNFIAPLVIGLGPGFTASVNCHAFVETKRGPMLGRVFWNGSAAPDSGKPETVLGYTEERVLRAPVDGQFESFADIGSLVKKGQMVARVQSHEIISVFDGAVRGMLEDGLEVKAGMKVGDIDPRNDPSLCTLISDKALAIGGGVLEAILMDVNMRSLLSGSSS